jgi:hypothetical protein
MLRSNNAIKSYRFRVKTLLVFFQVLIFSTAFAQDSALQSGAFTQDYIVTSFTQDIAIQPGTFTESNSVLPTALSQNIVLQSGSYTSSLASIEIPKLCTSHSETYPAQWIWDPAKTVNQPRAATAADNLTPRIDQVRNGKVIASYTSFGSNVKTCNPNLQINGYSAPQKAAASGCGPFGNVSHVDLYRLWQSGDTFQVYPAVYSGSKNNILVAPRSNYYQAPLNVASNITIQGVTVNGIRPIILDPLPAGDFASGQAPVYVWNGANETTNSSNIVIENIDLALDKNTGFTGKSGVYTNGATNLTLRQMRIHGFEMAAGNVYGANGIFTAGNDSGTLTLDQIELFHNGGGSGPAHNIYVNASTVDPSYTVLMTHSWSHDAFYGHTFKSRAQNNTLLANYFQGGKPQGGIYKQAENYLVDIPNGGNLILKNNVFAKSASGTGSNGAAVTFAIEGVTDNRPQSVNIENNTFVAFTATYDGTHPSWPFFFWNHLIPGVKGFEIPASPSGYQIPTVNVLNNAFVGFCPHTNSYYNYRGNQSATLAFSELNQDFSFVNKVLADQLDVIAQPAYSHVTQSGLTRVPVTQNGTEYSVIGAEDQ